MPPRDPVSVGTEQGQTLLDGVRPTNGMKSEHGTSSLETSLLFCDTDLLSLRFWMASHLMAFDDGATTLNIIVLP